MGLFTRKKASGAWEVAGLAEYAASQGWQPLGPDLFMTAGDPSTTVRDAREWISGMSFDIAREIRMAGYLARTSYYDGYGGEINGHRFVFAYAVSTTLHQQQVFVVQFSSFPYVAPTDIRPRNEYSRYPQPGRPVETGDANFDDQFKVTEIEFNVTTIDGVQFQVLSPAVRRLLLQRDDWHIEMVGPHLTCVFPTMQPSVSEVQALLTQVDVLVGAIAPALWDHVSSLS